MNFILAELDNISRRPVSELTELLLENSYEVTLRSGRL